MATPSTLTDTKGKGKGEKEKGGNRWKGHIISRDIRKRKIQALFSEVCGRRWDRRCFLTS